MTRFFTAHVRNGRLVLDEPAKHPDGTLLELVLADMDFRSRFAVIVRSLLRATWA